MPAPLTITHRKQQIQYFPETLAPNLQLNMVLIPGGSFIMGAPETERESSDAERPQHPVAISAFFMAQFPITQAQWRVVANSPKINRELNPDPSQFKGDNHPVEQINWYEALEFCDRLAQHTRKPYRLPSEAEWEYACRAGTTTPFHLGETITTDLANYRGTDDEFGLSGSYGRGPKGIYRAQTTPVGSFGMANDFGLYDMHGNVWEWCADHWHSNYRGAPENERDWLSEDESALRLLRGGSWDNGPKRCRSANRDRLKPDSRINGYGFRLACSLARTF